MDERCTLLLTYHDIPGTSFILAIVVCCTLFRTETACRLAINEIGGEGTLLSPLSSVRAGWKELEEGTLP